MAELYEEMALLKRKVAEEVQRAEEAQLAKLEEEKRIAEEERKQKEEEERRQAEEQQQVAIVLAEYQRNTEKAEADRAEAERIEAAKAMFKKREDADVTFRKVTAKVQRELKAKVRKEAAVARSESEKAEVLGKRGQEVREINVTVGSFLMEHGVEWMVKEGVVCELCEKKEKKCFWRMEAGRGKACLACHNLKARVGVQDSHCL